MNNTLNEIKLTYIIITIVMLFFIAFIIFVVLMYNRKQLIYLKEKQLKESEYQNQLLQKELEKQKSLEKERERISHDMHDDLGAGISALKLQAEFLKQKADDIDLKDDIDELLKTSEEMSISMREMLWSLHAGNDTIGSFIDYATLYSGSFLKKIPVRLFINSEGVISDVPISTELRRNLFLCLKEALNNIYKHSLANTVHLTFSQNRMEFLMTVSDNGIGIRDQKHSGNGLGNMKRRMVELGGICEISSEKGTQITFRAAI